MTTMKSVSLDTINDLRAGLPPGPIELHLLSPAEATLSDRLREWLIDRIAPPQLCPSCHCLSGDCACPSGAVLPHIAARRSLDE